MSFNVPLVSFPYSSWSIIHEGLNEPTYPAGLANGDVALLSVTRVASSPGGSPGGYIPPTGATPIILSTVSGSSGGKEPSSYDYSAGVYYKELLDTDSNTTIGGNQTTGYFYILRNDFYKNTVTLNNLTLEAGYVYNNTAPFGVSEPSVLSCFGFTAVSSTTALSANAALFDGEGPSSNITLGAGSVALSSLTIQIQDQYSSNTDIVQGITAGTPTSFSARPFYVEAS